ncbi:hypothetical protein SBADM41S_04631 [Streptomyces badius]
MAAGGVVAHGSAGYGVATRALAPLRSVGARGVMATAGGGLLGGDPDARSVRQRQQGRRARQHTRDP